jgi:exonuclease SbcC
MLLHKLHIKYFKRFREQEITFRDGITGIVGNNGAGKSTIVQAVLFALYGVKGLGKNAGDYIVSSFAGPKDRCEIRLDFHKGGHDYAIVRTFKKGASSAQHDAQLFIGGSLLASGVSHVDREMVRVIGMGAEDFMNTIYAGQKDLLSLLDETPGERQKWFMHVLGIDVLKKETDVILRERIREHIKKSDTLKGGLEELDKEEIKQLLVENAAEYRKKEKQLLDFREQKQNTKNQWQVLDGVRRELQKKKEQFISLNSQVREKEKNLVALRDEVQRIEKKKGELEALKDEISELSFDEDDFLALENRFAELSGKKERFDLLSAEKEKISVLVQQHEKECRRITEELESLRQDTAACSKLQPAMQKRQNLLKNLERLKQKEPDYLSLWREQGNIQTTFAGIEDRVRSILMEIGQLEIKLKGVVGQNSLEKEIQALESNKEELIEKISAYKEQSRQTGTELQETVEHLEEIEGAGRNGVCPTCHRSLGDHYQPLLLEFNQKIGGIENQRADIRKKVGDLEQKRVELENDLEGRKNDLKALKEALKDLSKLNKERTELMERAEECLVRLSEIDREMVNLSFTPDEKLEIEKEISRIEPSWKEYLKIRERLRTKGGKEHALSEVRGELQKNQERLAGAEAEISSLHFNPLELSEVRQHYNKAVEVQRRFVEMKTRIEQLPEISTRIRGKLETIKETESAVNNIRKEMLQLDSPSDKLESAERRLEECRKKLEFNKRSISAGVITLKDLQKTRLRLESGREKIRDYEEKIRLMEDEISLLKQTRDIISEYFTYLLHVVREKIEGEVGRVLGEITDGRYDNVLIDENFTVLVNDMGDNYPAQRFSGGEQDDIAIALRIALSQYLAEVHQIHDSTFLIFDEIFGSQDEERRNNLLAALRTQESHFPQIFLISHIPDIHGEFSNTMLVEMDEDNSSRLREL